MKKSYVILPMAAIVLGIFIGYQFGQRQNIVGEPAERIFHSSEELVQKAILAAFHENKYKNMNIETAMESHGIVEGWVGLANDFVLSTFHEPIGTVLVGPAKRPLPYIAYFHIECVTLSTNDTKVAIHTILSEVIDGHEPSIHGSANRYRKVDAMASEEWNVLMTISDEVRCLQQK